MIFDNAGGGGGGGSLLDHHQQQQAPVISSRSSTSSSPAENQQQLQQQQQMSNNNNKQVAASPSPVSARCQPPEQQPLQPPQPCSVSDDKVSDGDLLRQSSTFMSALDETQFFCFLSGRCAAKSLRAPRRWPNTN